MSFYDQSEFDVRCEWGPQALEHLASSGIVVIVDVLSFSTCVEIATARGAKVFPCAWQSGSAAAYAIEKQAELAGRRSTADSQYSLAPSSLVDVPAALRLVLPSPNGSNLAFQAKASGAVVVAGCLRNASALGKWLKSSGKSITVVPAGERCLMVRSALRSKI